MSLERPAWSEARQTLKTLLGAASPALAEIQNALTPIDSVTMHLPASIGMCLHIVSVLCSLCTSSVG